MTELKRGLAFSLVGAVYGTALFTCAFLAAGGGHGSYLPFAIFGAPLSLVHPQLGLFGVLIIWVLGGLLFGLTRRVAWRAPFLLFHALAVSAVLLWGNRFESAQEQWEYLEKARRYAGGCIAAGWTICIAGQLAAWFILWRDRQADRVHQAAG